MSFERFVSFRYLRAKRKQKFISLISFISVLGVAVGVMALIVVLSVYTGFTEGLRDQIIGINAHILVQDVGGEIDNPALLKEELEKITEVEVLAPWAKCVSKYYCEKVETTTTAATIAPWAKPAIRRFCVWVRENKTKIGGVTAATPYIYAQALISSTSASSGIAIRGIDPVSAGKVISLDKKMVSGTLADLAAADGLPGIVLGKEIARQLDVSVRAKIRLISPNGPLTPMGVMPKVQTCVVSGIFATGMYEYDSTMGFVSLETARRLAGMEGGGVHGLEVRVADIDKANLTATTIQQQIGQFYSVRDWMQLNRNLFAALKLEKIGIFIALDLIILVASLNIISALVMVVMEKNKDIAILKSMGAKTGSIMRIFFYQGTVIGLSGTALGVTLGLAICAALKRYKIIELPSNVYPMSTMPVKVVPLDVALIAVSAILITLIATLYPSWKASKVRPAEALTYE